jgi:hypothetical protein
MDTHRQLIMLLMLVAACEVRIMNAMKMKNLLGPGEKPTMGYTMHEYMTGEMTCTTKSAVDLAEKYADTVYVPALRSRSMMALSRGKECVPCSDEMIPWWIVQ